MSHPDTWRKDPNPGPPTWIEAHEGFARLKREAAANLKSRLDILRQTPEAYNSDDPQPKERIAAQAAFSAADAEWKHWHRYERCYEAFIRLHPSMINVKIDAPCEHKGACRVADDEGFYSGPEGTTPPMPARTREPGDDDEEEGAAA